MVCFKNLDRGKPRNLGRRASKFGPYSIHNNNTAVGVKCSPLASVVSPRRATKWGRMNKDPSQRWEWQNYPPSLHPTFPSKGLAKPLQISIRLDNESKIANAPGPSATRLQEPSMGLPWRVLCRTRFPVARGCRDAMCCTKYSNETTLVSNAPPSSSAVIPPPSAVVPGCNTPPRSRTFNCASWDSASCKSSLKRHCSSVKSVLFVEELLLEEDHHVVPTCSEG